MNTEKVDDLPDDEEDDEEEVKIPEIKGLKNYMTPACYKRLLDERHHLVMVERPEMVQVVSWAASNGDRSENGDYLYGKKRLREIDRRIRFLNKRLESSEVVDPDKRPETDQIFFGATVVYAGRDGEEHKIRIVGIDEADANVGDVSWISPIARVFLKHAEGDEVLLPTPKGVQKLEILEVYYTSKSPGKPHVL
jgi:transcription elongation factor GreB